MRLVLLTAVYSFLISILLATPRNLAERELREEIDAMNTELMASISLPTHPQSFLNETNEEDPER